MLQLFNVFYAYKQRSKLPSIFMGRTNPFLKSLTPFKNHNIIIDKTPKKMKTIDMKNTLRWVKSHVSLYHCAWLLIIFLFQIFILLVFLTTGSGRLNPPPTNQFSPIGLQEEQQHHDHDHDHDHQQQQPLQQEAVHQQLSSPPPPPRPEDDDNDDKCKYGKVYLYDLPSKFNKELVKNCNDLHPWKSRCLAFSNDGLGPNATTLAGTVPEELTPSWWWTDMFASEIMYHNRMSKYKCRTTEPESATAFYVPFYAGLSISKYLFTNYTIKVRDYPFERFLEWMKEQPYWKRSNGSDHFLMLGRITWDFRRKTDAHSDWGTKFLFMPLMKNMFHLTIEQHPWDPREVSVPYPTGFHPRSSSEIGQWQEFVRSRQRSSLFTFVGAKRQKVNNDFRALLFDHCDNEPDWCKLVDCAKAPCEDGSTGIFDALLHSDFCLQPKGDSETRKATFDCMLSGSIPVFFWERSFRGQYELFFSSEPESYSVFIDQNEVRNGTSVRSVLEGYSKEKIKRMRDRVIELIPRFLYAFPNEGLADAKDAFDIAVEEVLRRIVSQKSQANE